MLTVTAFAVGGTPQIPATGNVRVDAATSAGPPRGPTALRVSAIRHGVRVLKSNAPKDGGGVGVVVGVRVRVGVGVTVGVAVGVRVVVGVEVGVRVGVEVGVAVPVGVQVAVAVGVGVRVEVGVRVGVGVLVGVLVGVGVSEDREHCGKRKEPIRV